MLNGKHTHTLTHNTHNRKLNELGIWNPETKRLFAAKIQQANKSKTNNS